MIKVDCQLSSWTDWSPCDKACGLGTSRRTREIKKNLKHGGKPCSPLRQEIIPCMNATCPGKVLRTNAKWIRVIRNAVLQNRSKLISNYSWNFSEPDPRNITCSTENPTSKALCLTTGCYWEETTNSCLIPKGT